MKTFQYQLFYFYNSILLKTIISFLILCFCLFNLNAQIKHNVKLKVETGITWTIEEGDEGLFLSLEPKLKTSKRTFIGLRIGASENSGKNEKYKNDIVFSNIESPSTLISFVPTFEYYFIKNSFRPYLGAGVGYYFMDSRTKVLSSQSEELNVNVDNQLGFIFRGGFDAGRLVGLNVGKLTFGLEYNYLPKADITILNGQLIGTVDNSYIGLSLGYTIAIGKRSK